MSRPTRFRRCDTQSFSPPGSRRFSFQLSERSLPTFFAGLRVREPQSVLRLQNSLKLAPPAFPPLLTRRGPPSLVSG